MTTKLEAMVGYLAGRDGDPALLEELADPSSEASRFLEATRTRSRALLEGSHRPAEPAVNRSKAGAWVERLGWSTAAFLALGLTLGLGEARARRLEASLGRANAEARSRSDRVEAALARLADPKAAAVDAPDPNRAALGRVEAGLDRLERRVQELANRPESAPKGDPTLVEIRDQLALLRRELSSVEKAETRRVEELQASIHEVARLVRLLVTRSQPAAPATETPPRRAP